MCAKNIILRKIYKILEKRYIMKIPGIAYIIIGVFIAGLSGYVYKFVPKPDGTPNMSMALFFFIGVLFIIIGFIKLFFKKMDEEKEIEYHKAKKIVENKIHDVHKTPQRNRVEEQLDNAIKQQEQQNNQQTHIIQHTSKYAQTHPYQGIDKHIKQNTEQNVHDSNIQTSNDRLNISSFSMIVCKRCGDKNPSTTIYCHGCGNRLR